MNTPIYNPFKNLDFKNKCCFLSGEEPVEQIRVLPDWLIQMANLTGDEQIKLLDESIRSYKSLTVPANLLVFEDSIVKVDQQLEAALAKG